jgi:predicted DCC family thiol-disulfide oxidoreductase YuxK
VRAREQGGRVLALPSQTPGLVQQYGLTRAQTDRELWAVDSSGVACGGAAAVNRVLAALGGFWFWVAQAYRLAPIRWAEDWAYRWVADHRSRLWFWTTTPECDRPGAHCG